LAFDALPFAFTSCLVGPGVHQCAPNWGNHVLRQVQGWKQESSVDNDKGSKCRYKSDARTKEYYNRIVKRRHHNVAITHVANNRIVKRRHHNVAITHVANKMLKIFEHMLTEDTLYNERKEKIYTSKLNGLEKMAP
jgi:hypothetical protein